MAPKLSDDQKKKLLDIPKDKELPDDWVDDLIKKYRKWKEGIQKKLGIPENEKVPDDWLSKLEVKTVAQVKVENELEKKKDEIIELGITISGLNTRNDGLNDQIAKLKESLSKSTDQTTADNLKDQIRDKNKLLAENKLAIETAEWRRKNYQTEADNLHKQLLEEKTKQINEAEVYRKKWVEAVGNLTKETELRKKIEKNFGDYKITHPDTKVPKTTPNEKPKTSGPITGKEAITLLERDEQIKQLLVKNLQTNLIVDISTNDGVSKFKNGEKKFDTTIVPYKCKSDRWTVFINYNKTGDYAFFSSLNWNETNAPLIISDVDELQKTLIKKLTGAIRSSHSRNFKSYPGKSIMRKQIFPQREENIDSEIFPTGVIKKLLETDISIYDKTERAGESQLNNIFNGFQITLQELVALKEKYEAIVRQAQQEQHR